MDGEKELVLGNKQLVSFFFVVLALCGVFFALGYMIGRNSNKVAVAGMDGNTPVTTAPGGQRSQEPEPPRETALEPAVRTDPAAEVPTSPEGSAQAAQQTEPRTQPAHDSPEAVATPVEKASRAAATPLPGQSQAKESQLGVPEPGAMYLQVGALHHSDAETLLKTLREQGYPAVLATSSKPDFFRVLVGPYHQTAQVADTKAKLKTLGFADAFVLR
jgi:cell division protein FtsN